MLSWPAATLVMTRPRARFRYIRRPAYFVPLQPAIFDLPIRWLVLHLPEVSRFSGNTWFRGRMAPVARIVCSFGTG